MTRAELTEWATARGLLVEHADQGDASAVLSPCRRYRYILSRRWAAGPTVAYVMLNPSTADATADDPTTRRCRRFAERDGFGSLLLVNLFSLRTTDPTHLLVDPDPVGPFTDDALITVCSDPRITAVAAWGNAGRWRGRNQTAQQLLAEQLGIVVLSFGHTVDGHPRHPLYLRITEPMTPFIPKESNR
jgi:hypothetical protein